jgi:16S rRNA (cytosine1402-N4)-methyltransferase
MNSHFIFNRFEKVVAYSMFQHKTVLLKETVDGMNVKENGTYVDCTLGGAGHSTYILSQLSEKGKLIAFDQDDAALLHARDALSD